MAKTKSKGPKPLPKPATVREVWPIKAAYNAVRVVLTLRTSIDHYYTGLEVIDMTMGGVWNHVRGSARPHVHGRTEAKERVRRLLEGGWEKYIDPETTKPKRKGTREVASTGL
jgi:hypothetical protein